MGKVEVEINTDSGMWALTHSEWAPEHGKVMVTLSLFFFFFSRQSSTPKAKAVNFSRWAGSGEVIRGSGSCGVISHQTLGLSDLVPLFSQETVSME